MKLIALLSILSILFSPVTQASRSDIANMQGCYDVTFEYKEIESAAGVKPSADYFTKAKELVVIEKDIQDEIHLQHILITKMGVIKHWRQEWYNASTTSHNLMQHTFPFKWEMKNFEQQEDLWIQYVANTDDAPRYTCAAKWNNHSWSCEGLAPLPRREYTKRNDYNMMLRGNIVTVSNTGWTHGQVNYKQLFSQDGSISNLGKEIGKNTYTKINDEYCAEALNWWVKRRAYWLVVQNMWDHVFEDHNPLMIDVLKGDAPLSDKIDNIVESRINDADTESALKKIKKQTHDVIHQYMIE